MGLKEPGLRGSLRNTGSVTPAFFDVTITNTNSPVQEGDILTVDYGVDNTGDAQDMQDIRLEIDSVQEDVDPGVMLAGGASTTGTLEWDTTGEPEAEYTATVLSDNDSDSVTVEIGFAIPDAVVDNFEDAPDGPYESGETIADYYSGTTSNFERGTANAVQGSQALQLTTSVGVQQIASTPTDGLFDYPNEGDTVSSLIYTGSAATGPMVAAAPGVDGYVYTISGDNSELQIWRLDDSSYTQLTTQPITVSNNSWYWYQGRSPTAGDSTLLGELFEVDTATIERGESIETIQTSDSTHTGRGVGWAVPGAAIDTLGDFIGVISQ